MVNNPAADARLGNVIYFSACGLIATCVPEFSRRNRLYLPLVVYGGAMTINPESNGPDGQLLWLFRAVARQCAKNDIHHHRRMPRLCRVSPGRWRTDRSTNR